MASNGEDRMEKKLADPPRLGLLRGDETEEQLAELRLALLRNDVAEEEDEAAVGGVAGLVGRCESLSLAGGVEGGGFKILGLAAEGGGAGRKVLGGVGSDGEGGSSSVGQESGGSVLGQGFGLYVTVRMWREFSPKTLEKAMKGAWAPLGMMKMTIVEDNLFLFQFDHRPDVNKVLREGPWRLHDHPLAIVEARVGLSIRREQLIEIPYWVQIFNVPPFDQTERTARGVGLLISKKVLAVDATVRRHPGVSASFIRVRVVLNTAERLPRGASVWFGEEEVPLAFKFERLLKFCYICGMVDHEMDDCEGPFPENFDPAKPPYGDWMRGIPPRIPVWQQFASGAGGGGSSGNPFMVQNSAPRRPSIAAAAPVPRISWADREVTPKFPPGFEPAAFCVGGNAQPPSKRASIRSSRLKPGEDKQEYGAAGGKKRAADLMETSPPIEAKGANPFLPPA